MNSRRRDDLEQAFPGLLEAILQAAVAAEERLG